MTPPPATLLIADDDPQSRKLLETLLHAEGYATLCATNGEEVLALVKEHAPDLVLLDIMMPGMDGYQVAKILKANAATSCIPIIVVTALLDRGARLAGLNAGAEEFLTKPIDRSELWMRVRNLLRLKTYGDLLRDYGTVLEQRVRERTADLQRFRSAMDATADAIFLVERKTMRFVEVNATASRMLGYSRDELLQMGPEQVCVASFEQLERVYDAIIAGRATGELLEIRMRRKDGTEFVAEARRQAQRSGSDWIIVGVVRDLTERREVESRLHRLAHYDQLTALPNRARFQETLRTTIEHGLAGEGRVAVLCIDIDHFKNVNDSLGRAAGDELLRQFARRLHQCVPARDTVGRLGGDEFSVMLALDDATLDIGTLVARIQECLRAPFALEGQARDVTTSIGVATYPGDASTPASLMKDADTAMCRARDEGRDTMRHFTVAMNAGLVARLALEKELRQAVEHAEFVLHYQPRVRMADGRISGVEAFIRWRRPGQGLVPPGEFLASLEGTGLSLRVGTWVIATACRQIGLWMRGAVGPVQVSVNISSRQFIEGDLCADIARELAANGIAANLLELELTETALLVNSARTIATLRALKALGVRIAIDDFGTGYSSLASLRRFPLDCLKIDIAFIRDVTTRADDAAMVLAIIGMAHNLGLEAVAGGVETVSQLAYLRQHGCDHIQGHYVCPPQDAKALEAFLLEWKGLQATEGEAA